MILTWIPPHRKKSDVMTNETLSSSDSLLLLIKRKCARNSDARIFLRSLYDVLAGTRVISGTACGAPANERRCGRVAAGDDAAPPSDRGCLARVAPVGRIRRERRHRPIGRPAAWLRHLPGDDWRALDGRAGSTCCPHIELAPGTPAGPSGPVLSQTEPWQSDLVVDAHAVEHATL